VNGGNSRAFDLSNFPKGAELVCVSPHHGGGGSILFSILSVGMGKPFRSFPRGPEISNVRTCFLHAPKSGLANRYSSKSLITIKSLYLPVLANELIV
jgi:hypothetical protein